MILEGAVSSTHYVQMALKLAWTFCADWNGCLLALCSTMESNLLEEADWECHLIK